MSKFNPSDYPKFRKHHGTHNSIKGLASEKASTLQLNYGLKIRDSVRLEPKTLESVQKILSKSFGKTCFFRIRPFAHTPITKKPLAVRMGGGAGDPVTWGANLKPGFILCEVDGPNRALIKQTLEIIGKKLPCSTRFIERQSFCKKGGEDA